MKAIVIDKFGPIEGLVFKEIPTPAPKQGHVVIHIKAFGINHAELHMRRGEWAESAPVPGIECVGEVVACPGGEFDPGDKVVSLMGGLGRTINGSYAEFTMAPVATTLKITTEMPWAELAAIPETYATAWTCLFRNLQIQRGEKLLIRGATSSLGQAAIKLAIHSGVSVVATTRDKARYSILEQLGASRVEREGPSLHTRISDAETFDAVLDLVGNSTLLDSLQIPRRDGRLCMAGWLGGLDPLVDFNPLLQMASGVHFSLFASFMFGTPQFPLSDVPLQTIVNDIDEGHYPAKPSKVFNFDKIHEVHRVMENNQSLGKLVVVMN